MTERFVARRVVSGLSADGRSTVVADANTGSRTVTAGFTLNQIWQADSLPTQVDAPDSSGETASIAPQIGGFIYLVTTFPPDSEWEGTDYGSFLAASGDAESHLQGGGIEGLHQTDTIDIITVISGELWAVLETEEVVLRPGDSFVQRGTRHAWSNRSDEPCTIVALMAGATR